MLLLRSLNLYETRSPQELLKASGLTQVSNSISLLTQTLQLLKDQSPTVSFTTEEKIIEILFHL